MKVDIKYFTDKIDKIEKFPSGDWIDLRSAETIELKQGEYRLVPLGVTMKLPKGYEAHVVPRSSTFKNFGIIQTNSIGIIDNSYSGDNDQWMFPIFALRDTTIHMNDRICQFRKGKELGKSISQRKDGLYQARFINRFGERQTLYDKTYSGITKKIREE